MDKVLLIFQSGCFLFLFFFGLVALARTLTQHWAKVAMMAILLLFLISGRNHSSFTIRYDIHVFVFILLNRWSLLSFYSWLVGCFLLRKNLEFCQMISLHPLRWFGSFLFVCLFVCVGLYPRHMEVPRQGVKWDLQLLAYAMATATRNPSPICDLYHSSWQHWIPDPLTEARDRTRILMDTSQICFCCTPMGTSDFLVFELYSMNMVYHIDCFF